MEKRIEINTKKTSYIFAADSIKHIKIEEENRTANKCLYLTIDTTPFLVAYSEKNVKDATDELKSVFEELEKFIFEPTDFSKIVINISEEKTMIEPAYVIVELQCEHGNDRKECRNENIKHTISHSTDRYQVKVEKYDECASDLMATAKDMLEKELATTLNYDYVEIAEQYDGVYKTSYIQLRYE